MKAKKHLGVCLDHSTAHIIYLSNNGNENTTITARTTDFEHDSNLKHDESRIQQKEQNHLAEYYKNIAKTIEGCDEVILFGPTDARLELNNILKIDHRFDGIKIETKSIDKLTDNQMIAFVQMYFKEDNIQ